MNCRSCGTVNPEGVTFCINCGTPLAAPCAVCGAARIEGARFCGNCGTRFPDPAPPDAGTAVGSEDASPGDTDRTERRLVSVLFADLVGFTPYTEARDSEEVRETLDRYFAIARAAVDRHGGVVEKFIGDAVMAVWGAPAAREDDAERAVRAALELVDEVGALGVKARAAVLTGEAAVRVGVEGEGMVVGDVVNTAARLQGAAEPGTVIVGEGTYRAASQAIAFEPVGELALKGKASPAPAWRASRVVAERGGRNRTEALEAPFVGRADELRLLRELFHATERETRVRLVSVVGPAGIGKTRLASELGRYLDGLVDTVYWHVGRSPAYGSGVTFWALGEMVRARAGLLETDDEPTTRAKVAEVLARHVPEEAEQRWLNDALLALLGVETRVASGELFTAWRTFFERLAATAPVVMVFEDHHHADAGLLDFVDHVLESSRDVPICVLTLARPELMERRPDWAVGKRNLSVIHLEALPEPAMVELIRGLVPGLPATATETIVARAEGVPLYAVETVRMLIADGRLVARDGSYEPVGDLSALAVPETLTALITSRLDGLERQDRALMSDAAVLGQSFSLAGLAAVSGHTEEQLVPRLRTLVRLELLTLQADPRSPERGQYAFVQALIREVTYGTLARRDRKTRHLAAARFFESLDSDELAGALAGHYLAAHRYATEGPESDALAAQARLALRAAAERASALGSHEQALEFIEQAMSVTSDPTDMADLLDAAGWEAAARQRIDQAERLVRDALERREGIGDRSSTARTMTRLAWILIRGFRFEAATSLLEDGVARFADLRGDPGLAALEGQLARVYMLQDKWDAAVAIADRVLEVAERAELAELAADTLVTKGTALENLGRHFEGLALIDAGRRLAERNGIQWLTGRALNNLSSTLALDDPRASLEAARAGLELMTRMGERWFTTIDNAISSGIRTGEWDWALELAEWAVEDETDPVARGAALGTLLRLRGFRGLDVTDLVAELERLLAGPDPTHRAALEYVHAIVGFLGGDLAAAYRHGRAYAELWPQGIVEGHAIAARAAIWAGDVAGAREELDALQASTGHGRALDLDRLTVRAGVAGLEGRTSEALAMYRDALRGWEELGVPWDRALCAIDMAAVLGPGTAEVEAAADAARRILEGLGARPFLERLETALRGTASRSAQQPTAEEAGARASV
jgi:class 3 adenylate cyclase/tetratricopeptide (TPR) repeat protein